VAEVTEHQPKQEREGNHGYHSWVCLLVAGHTVRISDFLEHITELVGLKIRWSLYLVVVIRLDLGTSVFIVELIKYVLFIFDWRPEKADCEIVLSLHCIQILIQRFFLG
jgi:hypothetical protein